MVNTSPRSVYIHIPFCKSKCKYCSFVSFENSDNRLGYIFSLLKEINYYYDKTPLKTLYIGGGTPSLLDSKDLSKIISKFVFDKDAEITTELNPNDINRDYLSKLKDIGINRLSIGAQSFDDKILKLIGRRHTVNEIYKSVETAQDLGFKNISLDLIYGLPQQTIEGFRHDLKEVINLEVKHISLYGLKIEDGCYFYDYPPKNLPDDDIQADMYLLANDITSKHGYNHYEISNYSKPGYESKHNTNYWECGEYYGFGVSAHGYKDGIRYSNPTVLDDYITHPTTHEYGKFLTEKDKLEERIFLGLRLSKGIDTTRLNADFGIDFDSLYGKVLDKYLKTGHIIKTKNGYALSNSKTSNGFLLSNTILADFL